ncbi:PREDICTED: cytochrome c oxidase assembly factor 7-like isoform X2 [Acropora digitifera]|uniref:cytochrome c oxidase assembly factor 7-like isoform X2 n=1 Tax=Acropora digitifera TaxID=70779 RepID=UPI00077A5AE3|nr:PREDICTED: cytochrome c oxidase assembly factor 7-like isoform X2 [Acropora digitifera]
MSFNRISEDEAAEAAKEYADKLHEIYKHECYGTKKKESCHSLAEFYMAVEKNITKAKDLYYHTCYKLGFADSCFALGNLFLTQKEYKDPEKALSLFHRACEQKSSGACNNAGLVYQNGIKDSSIQKDMYKAVDMFQKSCDHGHPNGCFNLSVIYLTGKDGIPKDLTRALQLSLKSCGLMHPWACANLSRMYSIGDGVDKNQQEAEKYKRLAKKYSGRELRI